jgi:predicted Zn-dependent protease
MRLSLLLPAAAALTFAMASPCASAQQNQLPDIGSSAGAVLSPAEQKEYGQMMLAQLRHYDYIVEDPLVGGWLRNLGNRLGAASDNPSQEFTFFMMKDRQINAFATVGGYVGVNAGLVLAADTEDEVAAVLGHEIAHVTQSHVLRSVERAQRDTIPTLLGMLGAIAVAAASNSDSGSNGAMAALASIQGLAAQREINYTRGNESEADRIGMRTLARSGYDTNAMAMMFERMQALDRSNSGGDDRDRAPDYLLSHPVTTIRIAEAKERAAQIAKSEARFTPAMSSTGNPLLPASLRPTAFGNTVDKAQFGWVRERMRVLSADTPPAAIQEYERMRRTTPLTDPQRYGLALAHLLDGQGSVAATEFESLLQQYPSDVWVTLGLAQAEARAGRPAVADAHFKALLDRMPNNRAVALTYAEVLGERNNAAAGRQAQAMLRPLLASADEDPLFQSAYARANEIAGDPVRAGEAYAEAAYLNGRPEQALVQLNTLKRRDDLDYYARARIDARIAAITPEVLELRRQGIRDDDLHRD